METTEAILVRRHVAGIEQFEANELGIAVLKAEFLAEAEDFLYLRKGEDFGGDLIGYMSVCINALADVSLVDVVKDLVVYTTAAERIAKYYPRITALLRDLKELFHKKPWKRRPRHLQLLLWPDARNEAARHLYEKQGYEVLFYASELDRGHHRMYVNDKRYCLFLRTVHDRFVGFIGAASEMHGALKARFEEEWKKARKP